jgi:glycosyltransferase involved in cell wall biosynthesis
VVNPGGAEQCLRVFHELLPDAPLYTLFYNSEEVARLGFEPENVYASCLQNRRNIQQRYRNYLPFLPYAIEQLDLNAYDIILSDSHCAAKGVLTRADQLHICYCHTPPRYVWDLTHRYLRENDLAHGLKSTLARIVLHYLRLWDVQTEKRVDYFIANSYYTARRIWRVYRREAAVIYPPVETDLFRIAKNRDDYFVFVSRLVPSKHVEMVIEAFNRRGWRLKVVGDGPLLERCLGLAKRNVEIMGYKSGMELAEIVGRARAMVFAADEDFGIVPVEAQACGIPVIAYGRGGVLETVVPASGTNWDAATGIFFPVQEAAALESAVEQFLSWEKNFDPKVIRKNAQRFNRKRFENEIRSFIDEKYKEWRTQSFSSVL